MPLDELLALQYSKHIIKNTLLKLSVVVYNGVHNSVGFRVLGCGPKRRGFKSRCSPT